MRDGKQKSDIPYCDAYKKYENGIDLFGIHMELCFLFIQGKKWHWPLFANFFHTSLVANLRHLKLLTQGFTYHENA